ncbi:hypothetical protein [Acidithiobacillus ferrooxidans]|nr:hypothetical protein [Acidithiobacillus ferrooxidans]MCR1343974.1 hypothetical protein [Acidithiobacillus ferrooxidans]
MLANNETGTMQPVPEIAALAHAAPCQSTWGRTDHEDNRHWSSTIARSIDF